MLEPDFTPSAAPQAEAELRRLQALRRYNIVGTPPEGAFDRLAGLAARLFRAPIALITFMEEHRQWFKACVGTTLRENQRELSFCTYTVALGDVLVVPDTTQDSRFAHNPLVTGPAHLRFYAGAPLLSGHGEVIGSLCIMDTVVRPDLTPDERQTLTDLATSVMSELDLRQTLLDRTHEAARKDAILNSALDAVITTDEHHRVLEWNRAAEQMFGYTWAEAVGQDLTALIIPEHLRERHREGIRNFMGEGEGTPIGRRVEVPSQRRGGEPFPSELAITPFTSHGETLFALHLRDLSERHALREALDTSHKLLRAVVDTVPESMYVKDLEGRYIMINAAGAGLMGRPVNEILGQGDADLFPSQTAQSNRARDRQVLASGQPLSDEVTDVLADGSSRTFLATKSAFRDAQGEVQGLIGTAFDITARKAMEAQLQAQNQRLEEHVQARTQELEEAQLEILERLARAAEHRDDDTGEHMHRVARMAADLARQLALPEEEAVLIERVAPLHDVGKIGLSDAILLKPGRLTPEEFSVVKAHTTIGANILAHGRSELIQAAQEIAMTHHERWDGNGYPQGLAAEAIPLRGRIVAVADVFDALTSDRPYKKAWSREDALGEIRAQAGRQFDPRIVEALERLMDPSRPVALTTRLPEEGEPSRQVG
ncbi:PAS domain S-box protein [Deinococcus hopiensis]|uniref:Putative two-component system response regulator n=1 Tax=Deinococcus hopiensis KR-140 TaxID=695939 RepID=A0A1W1VF91_9DEIO|nr:PAS domain S-box protein [Deinococcus hopiensis]SMB91654.1 putative two-component system response regulator [Deinococcus hopiensis KR-140]